jgi:hypothetical protein
MQILVGISENKTEKLEGCWSGPEPEWRRIETAAQGVRQRSDLGPRPMQVPDLNQKNGKKGWN